MNNSNIQINEDFAKQLLAALYKLDAPIGALDVLISRTDDIEVKELLSKVMGEFMNITLNELMVPIYRCHPSLGRAGEPGPWLIKDK